MSDIAGLMYSMESDIIANMTRLLAKDAMSSAEYQMSRLAEIGTLNSLNRKTVDDYLAEARAIIDAEFEQGGALALSQIAEGTASASVLAIWSTWENNTMNQMRNLGMTLINSSQREYVQIVYGATAEALTGAITLQEAIAVTAEKWMKNGIELRDIANRKWSVEAYAQMVIRSNLRMCTTATQFQAMDENDIDLIEVDSHLGARPLCAPYQGKVYSRSGTSTKFPPLSSTSYQKDPAGLFMINCRHTMYAYNPKTGKTFKPYSAKENDKAYAESQRQRYLERQIRKAKREKDTIAILRSQKNMREFIDSTGRTRKYGREQIKTK